MYTAENKSSMSVQSNEEMITTAIISASNQQTTDTHVGW